GPVDADHGALTVAHVDPGEDGGATDGRPRLGHRGDDDREIELRSAAELRPAGNVRLVVRELGVPRVKTKIRAEWIDPDPARDVELAPTGRAPRQLHPERPPRPPGAP